MKERRKYERFAVGLPGNIEVATSGKQEVFDVVTCDVSAGGAFLHTETPIPESAQIKVRLVVASERLKELTGVQGLIKAEGTVVRCNARGIAISFDGDHPILGS